MNEIESYSFRTDFYNLENTEWFKRAVRKKERQTGLEYYNCGGGYDAVYHWEDTNVFEIIDECSVVAHFIKSEGTTWGYEVDFKNHRLENEYKEYDRTSPYDLVADYDWVL